MTLKEEFPVLGMGCAMCAARVEQALRAQKGVAQATVNFAAQTVLVQYDNQACTTSQLQRCVQAAGYDLVISDNAAQTEEEERINDTAGNDGTKDCLVGILDREIPFLYHLRHGLKSKERCEIRTVC